MPRASKTLLVLILAALLPLRAVAGVVIGFCAAGHHGQPTAEHVAQGSHDEHHGRAAHGTHAGHDPHSASAHHADDGQPAKPATQTCSICAEHCSSAAYAPCGATHAVSAHAAAEANAGKDAHAAPPFFPDQLDRPPLA
jgi:hypothetical protein